MADSEEIIAAKTNEDVHSTDEDFDSIMEMAKKTPGLTSAQSCVLQGWETIYHSLHKEEHKRLLFNNIANGLLDLGCFEDLGWGRRIQKWLPYFESLRAKDALDGTMDVLMFFLEVQEEKTEQQRRLQNRMQTAPATDNRSKFGSKKRDLLVALEKYLAMVEDKWHPKVQGSGAKSFRHSGSNKGQAVEIVFKEQEAEIVEILKQHKREKDFFRAFSYEFDAYTDLYYEQIGHSKNGFTKEKRAPRSEESKANSSKATREKWEERRQKKATSQSTLQ